MKELTLHAITAYDLDEIAAAFKLIGWNKPRSLYEEYLSQQSQGIRAVIVAREKGEFCGYVTIKWKSDYSGFNQKNIPEIVDLNVLPIYRNHGVGSALIAACEAMAAERKYVQIGLGVGMTVDYGNAQRLYVQLGYVPDGCGLHYKNNALNYGDHTVVDDDLVLYFIKELEKKSLKKYD